MYSLNNCTTTDGVSISGAGHGGINCNNHILRQTSQPRRGRPKGDGAGESTTNNHILRHPSQPQVIPPTLMNKSPKSGTVTINIPAGKDVAQSLFQFCCRYQVSVTVLSGSGWLFDAILLGQRSPIAGPLLIKSLSGTVTMNSTESCFPLDVKVSVGWDCELYGRMVGGRASTAVHVVAMMTVLKNVTVESVVGHNQAKNNTNVEITPSSNNLLTPRIINVQFGECYNSVTPHHLESPENLDNPKENETVEEHNLMNSGYDELMAVGKERVVKEETAVMNKTSSELNNNTEIEPLSDSPALDELDDDFWNSLSPIVDLSPSEGV